MRRGEIVLGWVSLLAVGVAAPTIVGAATLTGTLPSSATAAHLLFLECTDSGTGAPLSATIQVRDLAPVATPIVSVQLRKGAAATNSSDDGDGDAIASPLVFVNGGSGRYDVYVDKTAAGDEAYEVSGQCWTGTAGSGLAAGTSLFSSQGGAVPSGSLGWQILLVSGLMLAGWVRIAGPAARPPRPGSLGVH